MSSWNSGSGPASEPPPHRGALTGRCGCGACAEDAFLAQSCLLLSVGGRRRRRQEPGRLGSAPLGLPHRSQCHGLASDAAPGEALRLRPLQGHGSASQPHHARQAAGWHLGGTLLGPPDSIVDLGCTEVSEDLFLEYLSSLGESIFRGESYNLFDHNCNTFSNEVAQFLTGRKIPSYITDLPSEVLATPFGQALRPLLDSIQIQPPGGNTFSRHNGQS